MPCPFARGESTFCGMGDKLLWLIEAGIHPASKKKNVRDKPERYKIEPQDYVETAGVSTYGLRVDLAGYAARSVPSLAG